MKFSLTGIETRAREAIQQAEVSQQEFRKLAAMTGQLLVQLNASMGRWESGHPVERDARKSELLTTLQSIELSKEELAQVAAADRRWVIVDYINMIIEAGLRFLIQKPGGVNRDEGNAFNESVNKIRGMQTVTADDLRDFLGRFNAIDENVSALIDDYAYYLRTGEQRRPDVWARRGGGIPQLYSQSRR